MYNTFSKEQSSFDKTESVPETRRLYTLAREQFGIYNNCMNYQMPTNQSLLGLRPLSAQVLCLLDLYALNLTDSSVHTYIFN